MGASESSIEESAVLQSTALLSRIHGEYGRRIRSYLARASVRDRMPTLDEILGEMFIACRELGPEDDLWPAILTVLRAHGAYERRIARHEVELSIESWVTD